MLIPSIDLQGGQVVQLVQGERPALASDDIESWVQKFRRFPKVQLIDLDAAMGSGSNDRIVRSIAPRLPCRVGGGIRTVERAREVLGYGATAVIVGSSLFKDGAPDTGFAARLAEAVGADRIIAAVDSKGGQVVVKGWKETVGLSAVEAVQRLEPFCAEFLYTHVDKGRAHGGHRPPGGHGRPSRNVQKAHRSGRNHKSVGRSTSSTVKGSTRWWAWPSTPVGSRSKATADRCRSGTPSSTHSMRGSSQTSVVRSSTCSIPSQVSVCSTSGAATVR